MDDFVKKAFAEAEKSKNKEELDAFKKNVDGNLETIITTIGLCVGLGRMDKLAEVTMKGGCTQIFADFLRESLSLAFHIGYKAGREKE